MIQKYASSLFRDATLEFYGVKTARIKEIINVELPAVEVSGSSADFVFLLEDGAYLHFEFQTTYNEKDLVRFAGYDVRLYERDARKITTVVIYSANVKQAAEGISIGSLMYKPERIMMKGFDGDAVYTDLTSKIAANRDITDTDMLNLIFLPLMRHSMDAGELAVKSVQLAQSIPDTAKRNACVAAAIAFGGKYLNSIGMEKIKEALRMTELITMFIDEGIEEGIAKGIAKGIAEGIVEGEKRKSVEVAKRLFKTGLSVQAISMATGLDEPTVLELQTDLNEAV